MARNWIRWVSVILVFVMLIMNVSVAYATNREAIKEKTTSKIYDSALPARFYKDCRQKGTVETMHYSVNIWGEDYDRSAVIYLPYGYNEADKATRYNLMIMLHGNSETANDWVDEIITQNDYTLHFTNLYDNMIASKVCDPFILVSLETCVDWYGWNWSEVSYEQLGYELREIVLPYLAEHYNTYAKDGSLESLQAARSHFGIGGNSWGSQMALNSGLLMNYDLFGNYLCMSANDCEYKARKVIHDEENANLTPVCFYTAAGTYDNMRDNTCQCYYKVIYKKAVLQDGVNAFYHETRGGHEWKVWATEFFNAMHYMFKENKPPVTRS